MAAPGSTTIQLYYSTVSGHIPSAGNLAIGELAINAADGLLFYKDSNTSTVLQLNGTPAGGNTQVQFNDNGSFGAYSGFTFDGTILKAPVMNATTGIFGGTF